MQQMHPFPAASSHDGPKKSGLWWKPSPSHTRKDRQMSVQKVKPTHLCDILLVQVQDRGESPKAHAKSLNHCVSGRQQLCWHKRQNHTLQPKLDLSVKTNIKMQMSIIQNISTDNQVWTSHSIHTLLCSCNSFGPVLDSKYQGPNLILQKSLSQIPGPEQVNPKIPPHA